MLLTAKRNSSSSALLACWGAKTLFGQIGGMNHSASGVHDTVSHLSHVHLAGSKTIDRCQLPSATGCYHDEEAQSDAFGCHHREHRARATIQLNLFM